MRGPFRLPSRSSHAIRADVDAELRFHLDARTEELVRLGVPLDEARARALREFGDVDDARQYMRHIDRRTAAAQRRSNYVSEFRQDIVYAVRKLRGSPVFTIAAIATLALGIGANTAIFSLVNGVLLRPLPFPQPEQLYRVWSANRTASSFNAPVSPPDLDDWRAQRKVVADVGGYYFAEGGSGLDFTGAGDPQRLSAVFVSPGFFSVLDVKPALGRFPREDELVRGGPDKVALLTNEFWRRQFAASRGVVDSAITLNGEPFTVLGVMPDGFAYPSEHADIFVPYSTIPDNAIPRLRFVRVLDVIARARPGVAETAVRAEMQTITRRLAQQYQEDAAWDGATVQPLAESITGPVRRGLLVLFAAVAFVLLMACVNVSSLQLARASARGREIAVRTALGAGRGRIVRQLLTESLVLAMAGGVAGLLLAKGGMRLLLALSAGQLPRGSDVRLDVTVLAFALGTSLLTGLLFGLVPAWRASRGVAQSLREDGRGTAGTDTNRLRSGLVIAEVALAMILVIGAGLMVRSFMALQRVDAGFRPDHLLAVNFTINTQRHPAAGFPLYYHQVIEKVRTLPGVVSAGAAKDAPFRGRGERNGFTVPGMVVAAGQDSPSAMIIHISDGYFRTIGARMVGGREFAPEDRGDSPFVVVVNEAFAKQYFPGDNAVGKTIDFGPQTHATVVGVVNDIRQLAMAEPSRPTMYFDNLQNGRVKVTLVARTQGPPLAMASAVRDAIWSVDRGQTFTSIFTFDDAVSEALARPRLLTVLMGAFGGLGLILGALGVYGVLAYLVTQRQREIGVRLALGGRPRDVLRLIVRRGLSLATAGVVIGLAAGFALSRSLTTILYGVAPNDPLTMAVVVVLLLLVAALASWIPARRASRVDPIAVLRAD
jgi:predicted permease